MREDRARTNQAESFVNGEVILRPGEKPGNLGYLRQIFVDMGLKADAGMLPQKRLAYFEHWLGGRHRKTRCDGVELPSPAVVTADEANAGTVRSVGCLVQFAAQEAVGQDQSGNHAQTLL